MGRRNSGTLLNVSAKFLSVLFVCLFVCLFVLGGTGNSQGKHQPEGLLGKLDDYLLQPLLEGQKIDFSIPPQDPTEIVTEQGNS